MFFAFNESQFKEGADKLDIRDGDVAELCSIDGARIGAFYNSSHSDALNEMFERHEKETQDKIKEDKTGNGFIYDMFFHELCNHEYSYTCDETDTFIVLGISWKDLEESKPLFRGFEKARKRIMELAEQ
jgi:hypothetical protein